MDDFSFNLKNDNAYRLGVDIGFFAGFFLFASAFYLAMSLLRKLPAFVKYYHVVLFVIIVYSACYFVLKFRK